MRNQANISELYRQVQKNSLKRTILNISEKLGKNADMGDYIDDFQKSDAPQFKGASKEKRRKMAIAAYLDAKGISKEEIDIQEDGHVDVASAVRQCKTITEDAMQMLQKLQTMSPEDALPTWWTNKLAVASNSMNKMRDYLLVPSVSEETELEEDMAPDEIERDAKKAMSQFNSDMAKIYPSSKYFARATTAPMGGGIAFEFAVIPTSQAKGVDLRNAPAHSKFMMHLTDGFGKKVPLSKVSIQQIMGRLPTKFRKITARTPTDAVSKMVDFFKKNKSDFESLVKEEVELDEAEFKVNYSKDGKSFEKIINARN